MNQVQNSVTLIGNLGQAPQIFDTKNGSFFTKFSLATNESYMKDGEKIQTTQWHRCICFGKKAEAIHKLAQKGGKLAVQGKITYRNYTDKDGHLRLATNIEVGDFQLLDRRMEA